MKNIYTDIVSAKLQGSKLLAILIDPDKIVTDDIHSIASKIKNSPATHIFVGGSEVFSNKVDSIISSLKDYLDIPIVLFPGNPSQISAAADGILFLSLISGRNPDYLIGHQVEAAPILKSLNLEVIPTGYILVESGRSTAVETVSKTLPLSVTDPNKILHTAQAGELSGKKLIYLEAGSGAENSVPTVIIQMVSSGIDIPLVVGGGIKTKAGISAAWKSGADLVVIGTAFENDYTFFET